MKIPVKTTNIDKFLQHFAPAEDEPENVEAPEETGPVTVPPFCHYEICRDGKMELCGADATETGPDLCAEHAAFVKDSTVGPFTASKKAHPADYDWSAKMRAAYGVKAAWAGGAFPLGIPSDAGKAVTAFYTEAQRSRNMARIPESPAGVSIEDFAKDERTAAGMTVVDKKAEKPEEIRARRIAEKKARPVDNRPIGQRTSDTAEPVNVTPCPVVSEPEPVAVVQPGYCVQIKVYGEWRTQKAGLEGASAGNMRDGMARMGYEARVMYGPGVVADPVEIKEAEPAHIGQDEPQPVEAGNGEYTREEIEAACVRLMEQKDTYRGTGIPGVLWNVGFRLVYQKRAGSDAQIAFIRALIAKKPEKYAPLLV